VNGDAGLCRRVRDIHSSERNFVMSRLRTVTLHGLIAMILAILALPSIASASDEDRLRVEARLFGPTPLKGKARYEERQRSNGLERRFKVEVERGVPGSVHTILVNGNNVGLVIINALGRGKFQLRTPEFIDSPGDGDPMPANFPNLTTGDTVNVGPISGVFFIKDGSDGGGGGGGGVQQYRLRGGLIDQTPADGHVEYRERLRSTGLERRFKVEIEHATADTDFQVRVNGQLVATITTSSAGFVEFQLRTAQFIDSPGDGEPMPGNFPSLQDGDIVTVGGMTATLRPRGSGGGGGGGGGGDD
jgi:hypothetical protein